MKVINEPPTTQEITCISCNAVLEISKEDIETEDEEHWTRLGLVRTHRNFVQCPFCKMKLYFDVPDMKHLPIKWRYTRDTPVCQEI